MATDKMINVLENVGVGIDICKSERFKDVCERTYDRVFTDKEREYCRSKASPERHFAARYAAKEAIIKAYAQFGESLNVENIEIDHDENGKPVAVVHDYGEYEILLSMSHEDQYSTAVALVYCGVD